MTEFHSSLDNIVRNAHYCNSGSSFFSQFADSWEHVQYQVLKLETRQEYLEPGNASFEMLASGNFEAAVNLINEVRSQDDGLYEELKRRGVDFIRCRPVKYPFTDYLRWELETYKVSAVKGERIFCCLEKELKGFFNSIATKDFMVFDSKLAFIHNYDEKGLIQGGWRIENQQDIYRLQSIFVYIKSFCSPFEKFV